MNQFENNIAELISNVNEIFFNYKLLIDEGNVIYLNKYRIGINLCSHTDSDDIASKIINLKNKNNIKKLYIELSNRNIIKIDYMIKEELSVGYFNDIKNPAKFYIKRINGNNNRDCIIDLLSKEKMLDAMKLIQYFIFYNCVKPQLVMNILNGYINKLHNETDFGIKNNAFYLKYKCLYLHDLDYFKINVFNKNINHY
ncbi:TPA: hypothetical protein U2G35_002065 [Yersinia enterocolitica]|nr:hypothetical protein [Yersinia enterocolitica]